MCPCNSGKGFKNRIQNSKFE
ncbi:MAG: SEC-C metal-binding domain-containing protein [Candidatus Kapaibacterium sp.]